MSMGSVKLKPPSRDWSARWIWSDDEGTQKNSYYYFRKEFELKKNETGTKLHITADSRYRLLVNGELVGDGSIQSQPYYKYYDIRQLDQYLKTGKNTVAVIVNYVGNIEYTRGGFLAELINGDGEVIVASNDDWKVKKAVAWHNDTYYFRMAQYTPYQEIYDSTKAQTGWTKVGFDDSDWDKAKVLSGKYSSKVNQVKPWTYLVPRDIPFMTSKPYFPVKIEKTEEVLDIINRMRGHDLSIKLSMNGKPVEHSHLEDAENLLTKEGVTVVRNSTKHQNKDFDGIYSPAIIIDFGKVITAFVEMVLTGVEGGKVDIGYTERLFDGNFNNSIESQFADRYIMQNGEQVYRPFTWKAFRYLKIQFHECFEEVKIKSLKAIINTFPYQEKGSFESSNIKYNKLFDISRYTIGLCSNEAIMDTPWREQAQFLGDVSAVTLGGIYSCFGNTELPAKYLKQCGANQYFNGFIPDVTNTVEQWDRILVDYNLWWINAIYEHYLYTGEEVWLHQYYPHIVKIINTFSQYIDEYGLINNMPYGIFIDWIDIDRRGECSNLNAIFFKTLSTVIKIAGFKKDSYTVDFVKGLREGIQENFVSRFYNEEIGCFVDANINDRLSTKVSEHINCAVFLWDIVDKDMAPAIISKLYEEKTIDYTEAQPFFSAFVLQTLDKLGRFDLALEIIDERWIKRMVDRGAQSTYEEWTYNGSWRNG